MHLLLAKTANSLRIKTAFPWWPLSQVGLGENGMGVQSINYSLVPEQSREQRLFTFLPSVILGSCVWGTWGVSKGDAKDLPGLLLFTRSVVSDSLGPHALWQTRLPCLGASYLGKDALLSLGLHPQWCEWKQFWSEVRRTRYASFLSFLK